jgi:hypothetical protein
VKSPGDSYFMLCKCDAEMMVYTSGHYNICHCFNCGTFKIVESGNEVRSTREPNTCTCVVWKWKDEVLEQTDVLRWLPYEMLLTHPSFIAGDWLEIISGYDEAVKVVCGALPKVKEWIMQEIEYERYLIEADKKDATERDLDKAYDVARALTQYRHWKEYGEYENK